MKPDDLDRVLGGSREIEPSDGFAGSVMVAVRREVAAPPPLAFPWKRTAFGLATCAALAIVGVTLAAIDGSVRWTVPDWILALRSTELAWTAGALTVSLVSSRWSMRLVGYRS